MRFTIETDGQFEDIETVESFDGRGHRDTRLSHHLDALKLAAAWGYHKYDGYRMTDEDGHEVALVDPYKSRKWERQIKQDLAHITAERARYDSTGAE